MEKKKILITLGMILTIVLMVTGSTYAYLGWVTSADQRTNVVFTLEQDFWCAADGGGDITSNDVVIAPTSCTNSDHAIMREITVTPNILRDNLEMGMDLWLNIDYIDEAFSDSENLMYALTMNNTSCTKGVISSGTFNGLTTGNQAPILEKTFSTSTPETYYLWIWLDSKETDSSTMGKNFQFSIGGNCTDTPQDNKFYVVYSADDTSLRFYQEEENVINVGSTYDGRTTTAVYKVYETDVFTTTNPPPWAEYADSITNVVVEDTITPTNTQYWFYNLSKAETVDVSNLDTSSAINTRGMFYYTGAEATNFTINGLENFNTSNVVEMAGMFFYAGNNATSVHIGNLSNWDTSKVQNMQAVFQKAGENSSIVEISGLGNWDVSNVVNLRGMFGYFASNAESINLGNLGNWDVSNVTDMYSLFGVMGRNTTGTIYIGDLSSWDVSNVTNMSYMFYSIGENAKNIYIGDLSNWNVSNATTMSYMFGLFGFGNTESVNLGNLGGWNVSNVNDMSYMFHKAGQYANNIYIGDLSSWDVSNVTDMTAMFDYFGAEKAGSLNLGDLGNWNVSKVTSMNSMFYAAGYHADWLLDLSQWDVSNVTDHDEFNGGVQNKVIAPTWKN